jgi:hypothetical protein
LSFNWQLIFSFKNQFHPTAGQEGGPFDKLNQSAPTYSRSTGIATFDDTLVVAVE